MQRLLESDHFTIQSQFRWFPSLNTKFQLLDDEGGKLGEVVVHPVWMFPVLWLVGLLLELGMIVGGVALIAKADPKWLGGASLLLGLFFLVFFKLRMFLATRAPSSLDVYDESGESVLQASKGWALWRPTFSVTMTKSGKLLGQARQSFFWGDLHTHLWDGEGNKWGSIQRRIFGFQYRVYKGSEQIARFRRKLVDTRKLITGVQSYLLEYQSKDLQIEERAFILGTLTYVDALIRQKKLRQGPSSSAASPTQKS